MIRAGWGSVKNGNGRWKLVLMGSRRSRRRRRFTIRTASIDCISPSLHYAGFHILGSAASCLCELHSSNSLHACCALRILSVGTLGATFEDVFFAGVCFTKTLRDGSCKWHRSPCLILFSAKKCRWAGDISLSFHPVTSAVRLVCSACLLRLASPSILDARKLVIAKNLLI